MAKSRRIQVWLTEEQMERVREMADRTDRPISNAARHLIVLGSRQQERRKVGTR